MCYSRLIRWVRSDLKDDSYCAPFDGLKLFNVCFGQSMIPVPKASVDAPLVVVASIGNEIVPKIIINNTINLLMKCNQYFGNFKL